MHDTTHWTGQVSPGFMSSLLLWISTGGNFLVMEKQKLVENDDRVFDLFRVQLELQYLIRLRPHPSNRISFAKYFDEIIFNMK